MTQQDEWRTWNLCGLKVTQLRFDFQFHLHIWSLERDLLLTFGTPFSLRSHDAQVYTYEPERSDSLCPLLSLLHRNVATFAASSNGECVLRFEDGSELRGEHTSNTRHGNRTGLGNLRVHPCYVVLVVVRRGAECSSSVTAATQQIVGRERRERVSQHDWSGDA